MILVESALKFKWTFAIILLFALLSGAFFTALSLEPTRAEAGITFYHQCPTGVAGSQARVRKVTSSNAPNFLMSPDPPSTTISADAGCNNNAGRNWLIAYRNGAAAAPAASSFTRIAMNQPYGGAVMSMVSIQGQMNACVNQAVGNRRVAPQLWASSSTVADNIANPTLYAPISWPAEMGSINYTQPNTALPCKTFTSTPAAFTWNNQQSVDLGFFVNSAYTGYGNQANMGNDQAGIGIGMICSSLLTGSCGASAGQYLAVSGLRMANRDISAPSATADLNGVSWLGDWGGNGAGAWFGTSNAGAGQVLIDSADLGTGVTTNYYITQDGALRGQHFCAPAFVNGTDWGTLPERPSPCGNDPAGSQIQLDANVNGFVEGLNSVYTRAEDYSNNPNGSYRPSGTGDWDAIAAVSATRLFVIDNTPPTAQITGCSGTVGSNSWYLSQASCSFTATDANAAARDAAVSGFNSAGTAISYVYGGPGPNTTVNAGLPGNAVSPAGVEGNFLLAARATDAVGNVQPNPTTNLAVNVDLTNPTATPASCTPVNGSNGWHQTAVNCSLSVTDSISRPDTGQSRILPAAFSNFALGGVSTDVTRSGNAPVIDPASQGLVAVEFRGNDQAGRVGSPESRTFRIDRQAPAVAAATGVPAGWSNAASVPVGLPATDVAATTNSGIDLIRLQGLGGSGSEAANLASGVNSDAGYTPPPDGALAAAASNNVNRTFNFTSQGAYSYQFQSRDAAGRSSAWGSSFTVRIDRTLPTTSFSFPGVGTVVSASQQVTLNAADQATLAGLSQFRYALLAGAGASCAGVNWTTATNVSLTGNPTTASVGISPAAGVTSTICQRAVDAATNVASITSSNVTVDNSLPTLVVSGDNPGSWANSDRSVTATSNDILSGIASLDRSLVSGSGASENIGTTLYTATPNTARVWNGSYTTNQARTYRFRATDQVGNLIDQNVFINIDKAAPAVAMNAATLLSNGVLVSGSATDQVGLSGAGNAQIEICVDNGVACETGGTWLAYSSSNAGAADACRSGNLANPSASVVGSGVQPTLNYSCRMSFDAPTNSSNRSYIRWRASDLATNQAISNNNIAGVSGGIEEIVWPAPSCPVVFLD